MAQKTFTSATLSSADVNTYLAGEGGAWTTWTPTLMQSGTVTKTVNHAVYGRWGRLIVAMFRMTVTGSGTAGSAVTVSNLPATGARTFMLVGTGTIFDSSASLNYTGNILFNNTTTVDFRLHGSGVAANPQLGVTGFTAGLATNDIVDGFMIYEAAT